MIFYGKMAGYVTLREVVTVLMPSSAMQLRSFATHRADDDLRRIAQQYKTLYCAFENLRCTADFDV